MAAASSTKYIVVGIDGTSSGEWRRSDGSNSHVYRFVHDFQYGPMGIDKLFLDGPSDGVMGRATEPILQRALDLLLIAFIHYFLKCVRAMCDHWICSM